MLLVFLPLGILSLESLLTYGFNSWVDCALTFLLSFSPPRNLYLPPHFVLLCKTLWIPSTAFGYGELLHHQNWVLSSALWMQNSLCYCNSGSKPRGHEINSRSLDHCWTPDTKEDKKRSTFKSFHAYMEIKPKLKTAISVQDNPHLFSSKAETQNEYYKRHFKESYQTHRHHKAYYRTIHCTS